MSNIAADIARRRVWHGARSALRVIRVRIRTHTIAPDLADRAWGAIAEAAGDCPPLAEDWDAGPHQAAFLALREDDLAAELRAALAALAASEGLDPDDLGEVDDEELALPAGIHHWGDGTGGTVILAVDADADEALVVEWTQRLPD